MQRSLLFIAYALFAVLATAAEPPDLTGAVARTLDARLSQTVSLRGKLVNGVDGFALKGAVDKELFFLILPDAKLGGDSFPISWTRLRGQDVRVTGALKFRKVPRPPNGKYEGGWSQPPPDCYYMVLQQAEIEPAGDTVTKPPGRAVVRTR